MVATIEDRETQLLPLSEAVEASGIRSREGGKRHHMNTLRRWCLRGVRGPDGKTVKLDAVRCPGGAWMTTVEAVKRFIADQQTDQRERTALLGKTPKQRMVERDRAAKAARAELGIEE
jgi:hypothetical protein